VVLQTTTDAQKIHCNSQVSCASNQHRRYPCHTI